MKTLLITGANGFTGQHLIKAALMQGYQCLALVRDKTVSIRGAECIQADLDNFPLVCEQLKAYKIDYVIHLAAISFVAHGSVAKIYQTNLIGTLNLLDALIATQSSIKKVVLASSGNVYGESHCPPIVESMRPAPVNDYGASKVAMELACSLRKNKLPMLTVRPFNYTGQGQGSHFLIPKILQAYANKEVKLELGNLDVARDFSDVRDICVAYLRLLNVDETNQTYNVCSGVQTQLLQIVKMVADISQHNLEVQVNPEFVRANEIKELYGSDEKLKKIIGDYRQYSLQNTLEWMWETSY